MTRKVQKDIEIIYAEETAKLLGESWRVSSSPNETEWPDLLVITQSEYFGLEVRELFPDESVGGSTKKSKEQNNLKNVKNLANAYYEKNNIPVRVNLLGDIGHQKQLLRVISEEASLLSEFEQKRIEVYDGCMIYILRLPIQSGQFKRWSYITDKVGWVGNIDNDLIGRAIYEKAKNLSRYIKNISEVRLLLVSNRVFNSGKCCLKGSENYGARGFNKIYYLSYPQEARQIA